MNSSESNGAGGKKAKVVHLVSAHSSSDTRVFYRECRSLAKAGYQVTLVAPQEHDEWREGIQIKAFPRSSNRVGRLTRTLWRVGREALRSKAHICHFHDLELIPVGLFLRACGKKVVYDVHEDYPRRGIFAKHYVPGWRVAPLERPLEYLEGTAAHLFSAVVTVVPALTDRFIKQNCRTVMIQNLPSVAEFQKSSQVEWANRTYSVGYVGQINQLRGVREMVEAIGLVPPALNARLKLAGAFAPAKDRDLVMLLPGWRHVEYMGVVDRDGVAKLLGQVRAGLVLIHDCSQYNIALSTKLFEYMAAGVPVIASDFGLMREIVANAGCGLLVDPLKPEAVASAIEYLLSHPREAEAMGRRGRTVVETALNWESEQRKLLELYAELADEI